MGEIHVYFSKTGSEPTVIPEVLGVPPRDPVFWHIHSGHESADDPKLKTVTIQFAENAGFFSDNKGKGGVTNSVTRNIDYNNKGGVGFIYGTAPDRARYPYKYTIRGEMTDGMTAIADPVIVTDAPPPK